MGLTFLHVIGGVLGAALAALLLALDGVRAVFYVAMYLLAVLPGLPVGFRLFGPRNAAGWIAGAVLGYALTAVALWVPIYFGVPGPLPFGVAWGTLAAVTWLSWLRRRHELPLVPLPEWTRRDSAALCAVLLLVPILVALPFLHVGAEDDQGNRYYRAYFTADFLWHMALTAEVARFDSPPVDPYAAGETLHYYWTYFLVPAVASAVGPEGFTPGIERILLVNALCAGLLFFGMVFVFTWSVVPRALPAALAVGVAVLAASAEGTYGVVRALVRGEPLSSVRQLNIDALTHWFFQSLMIDGLPRSLWYVPQHAAACALGLVGLVVAVRAGVKAGVGTIAIAGVAFALSVMFSPLLGGAFSLVYGLAVATQAFARPREAVRLLLPHAVAAVLVVLAIEWGQLNAMFEGAGNALTFGIAGYARRSAPIALLLSLGPLLLPGVLGLVLGGRPTHALRTAAFGVAVGFFFFYCVTLLDADAFWVGFRAGQILLVTLPALAAAFFARALDSPTLRRWGWTVAVTSLLVGLPTTIIDTYNAQDIWNEGTSTGFHWTIRLTPEQRGAFAWIRRNTPADAIVQMEPSVRGRETWTHIPSFAERRMAAGQPISLLATEARAIGVRRVREIYGQLKIDYAWRMAVANEIDYVYVDEVEREAFTTESLQKFDADPRYFQPIYRRGPVAVYEVVAPGVQPPEVLATMENQPRR